MRKLYRKYAMCFLIARSFNVSGLMANVWQWMNLFKSCDFKCRLGNSSKTQVFALQPVSHSSLSIFNHRQIMLGRVSKAVISLATTLALICALLPSSSQALYFYLEGSEQKCFIEELPKDTTVLGT
jgi:hypothetical protein